MDQYYIIRILGRGSEGNVILAQHKTTHDYYAIKRMEWHTLDEANLHLQEANRMKRLNHRNIVQYKRVFLHKYSKETQFVCICLEYCEGGDLYRLIERAKAKRETRDRDEFAPCLDENDILRYSGEICQGLAFLHENNIIHRDLKYV